MWDGMSWGDSPRKLRHRESLWGDTFSCRAVRIIAVFTWVRPGSAAIFTAFLGGLSAGETPALPVEVTRN